MHDRPEASARLAAATQLLATLRAGRARVEGLKGVIFNAVGGGNYAARIVALEKSPSTIDQIGGFLMQADPATLYIAKKIASLHP